MAGLIGPHPAASVADKLTGGSADFAGAVEVHEMSMKDSVATMRQLPGGLEIPAKGAVTLALSGYHLMFEGLKRRLSKGEKVKVTLTFEHAACRSSFRSAESARWDRAAPGNPLPLR